VTEVALRRNVVLRRLLPAEPTMVFVTGSRQLNKNPAGRFANSAGRCHQRPRR
jgi:hypothetical protein